MGAKVDLIQEIYNRLNTAVQSGSLQGVKRVRVGSVEEARTMNQSITIGIQLIGGNEVSDFPNRMFTDDMQIRIYIVHPKLKNETNVLFKTSDSSGALFLLEEVLNVLDETSDGTKNNTFSGNTNYLRNYAYSVDMSADVVVISVDINVRTKTFPLGGR